MTLGFLLFPLMGAILAPLCRNRNNARWIFTFVTGLSFLLCLAIAPEVPFAHRLFSPPKAIWTLQWGLDMPAWLLCITTTFVFHIISWIEFPKEYSRFLYCLLFFIEFTSLGFFMAQDLLSFAFFFEASLIPSVLLLRFFGGEGREQAILKMLGFFLLGAIAFLGGIWGLHNFCETPLLSDIRAILSCNSPRLLLSIFASLSLGVITQIPLFPFHLWLPDAHSEAPNPVTISFSAVLLNVGAFGLYRLLYTIFPSPPQSIINLLLVLSAFTIIWGGICAFAQEDFKRSIVYISLMHMGSIAVGLLLLRPLAAEGAILQMMSHSLISLALFAMASKVETIYFSRNFSNIGGFYKLPPGLGIFLLIFMVGNLTLPGTIGFIGEFILLHETLQKSIPALCALGIGFILTGFYSIRVVRLVNMGTVPEALGTFNIRPKKIIIHWVVFGVLSFLIFMLGIIPWHYKMLSGF